MNAAYGFSGSFWSRVRKKSIVHNTYTGIISNFRSKSTPIHGTVYKYYLKFSYSRSNFSWLPQAVSKGIIKRLSHKVRYADIMINPVINGKSYPYGRKGFLGNYHYW